MLSAAMLVSVDLVCSSALATLATIALAAILASVPAGSAFGANSGSSASPRSPMTRIAKPRDSRTAISVFTCAVSPLISATIWSTRTMLEGRLSITIRASAL
jgi:hypothetical protein